jgi:hypothetical protein
MIPACLPVLLPVRVGESAKCARDPVASQQPTAENDRNPARYPMSGHRPYMTVRAAPRQQSVSGPNPPSVNPELRETLSERRVGCLTATVRIGRKEPRAAVQVGRILTHCRWWPYMPGPDSGPTHNAHLASCM